MDTIVRDEIVPAHASFFTTKAFKDKILSMLTSGSSRLLVKLSKIHASFFILCKLSIVQDPLTQESKPRPAIYDPFDGLQFIDFAFGNSLAPRQTECGIHGIIIALNASDEALQL